MQHLHPHAWKKPRRSAPISEQKLIHRRYWHPRTIEHFGLKPESVSAKNGCTKLYCSNEVRIIERKEEFREYNESAWTSNPEEARQILGRSEF